MHSKCKLIKYECDQNGARYEYQLTHDNAQTTLEQKMIISGKNGDWAAEVELKEFPAQTNPVQAGEKLAEWLERLAKTIRSGAIVDLDEAFIEREKGRS